MQQDHVPEFGGRLIYKSLYMHYRRCIMKATTIQLDKDLVESLKGIREYPRQTYNELIEKMILVFKSVKKNNQYDEFLHKIQQTKMKELWDNDSDEAWEHA
jgi:hypothetical protein